LWAHISLSGLAAGPISPFYVLAMTPCRSQSFIATLTVTDGARVRPSPGNHHDVLALIKANRAAIAKAAASPKQPGPK
jgi:hypothetical protein